MVAVLAGGTGGAKLAAGLAALTDVAVIANTGDDIEIYGVHVSPDPDLVTWWLAGIIDERGWGIAGDTFEEMKRQDDPWFQLGDRDLELCRAAHRARCATSRLTEAHAQGGRGGRRQAPRAADVRRAGAHPRAHAERPAPRSRSS